MGEAGVAARLPAALTDQSGHPRDGADDPAGSGQFRAGDLWQENYHMKRELIEDDAAAKTVAEKYDCAQSMMAEAEAKLPEALAAQVGIVICAKRAAPVATITGPFEFVFITLMAGFIEGENGWIVFRWSDVSWDELPFVCEQMELMEKQLLPHAVGQASATEKLAKARKE